MPVKRRANCSTHGWRDCNQSAASYISDGAATVRNVSLMAVTLPLSYDRFDLTNLALRRGRRLPLHSCPRANGEKPSRHNMVRIRRDGGRRASAS